jgi:hypothetical protein
MCVPLCLAACIGTLRDLLFAQARLKGVDVLRDAKSPTVIIVVVAMIVVISVIIMNARALGQVPLRYRSEMPVIKPPGQQPSDDMPSELKHYDTDVRCATALCNRIERLILGSTDFVSFG